MTKRGYGKSGSKALKRALAAVEALGETDAVVVPATPTQDMIAAGARIGSVSHEVAARVYRAMVLAFTL